MDDIIFKRRSIRNYSNECVESEDLNYILHAAMSAPTARNSRCYSFIVITNNKIHKKIATIHQSAQMILKAPLAILVVGDQNKAYEGYLPQDCAAATQNILLAATAKNYGSVWCGIYSNKKRSIAIEKLFNLPENIKAFSLVVIGRPIDDNNVIKSDSTWDISKIHYEKW
ncbi:MAG: nitroreductase family protein [Endomicrobium sp.]|jgi:nitroreductase|nr:nitroreductase family protein [Endomicrobium sp.]